MKYNALFILFIWFSLVSFNKANHPLKLTASEIRYNEKSKQINMECKVFVDDFGPAVNSTIMKKILDSNLSDDDKLAIENYFALNYRILVNDKLIPLKIADYTVKSNVLNLVFAKQSITLKKGDKLVIENNLLFKEFGPVQSNWVTLRIPPFVPNNSFESKLERYAYSKIL